MKGFPASLLSEEPARFPVTGLTYEPLNEELTP